MKPGRKWIILVCLIFLQFNVLAQKKASPKQAKKNSAKTTVQKKGDDEPAGNVKETQSGQGEKVKDIVRFFEYMLNTIGSKETAARDKEVLVTQSYSKIFRDDKVQIEDDLDEKRNTITNKDVVAYLKDVDFFFSDVHVDFDIQKITPGTLAGGKIFYKVSLSRHLKGITSDGQKIDNTIPRYIEINYEPSSQDLKIVSVYTNEFNEKESLTTWWNELSYEWQTIFEREMNITDSVTVDDLRNITSLQTLDLSNNHYIQNISPLSMLLDLKDLNLENTSIHDISPIRNLSDLQELNIAHTPVSELSALRYAVNLTRLNMNFTNVNDLSPLERLVNLKQLEINNVPVNHFEIIDGLTGLQVLSVAETSINDLKAFPSLTQIRRLNIAKTAIQSLDGISTFKFIKNLNIDSTFIDDITLLKASDSLVVLHANYTDISNLLPLQGLTRLEKIFCDQSKVTKAIADDFNQSRPNVLVIYDSKDLQTWWSGLQQNWQNIFRKKVAVAATPDKEQLAMIINIDSLNLAGNYSITDLEPVYKLEKLRTLNVSKTNIHDLSPLKNAHELYYIDISETPISDISQFRQCKNLVTLKGDRTKIEDLEPLYDLPELKQIYVDHTYVQDMIAHDFLKKKPDCLVIYKTIHLQRWWKSLSPEWKKVFFDATPHDTTTTRENLHKMAEQKKLVIQNIPVKDLSPLEELINLDALDFSGTAITTLSFPGLLTSLRSLHATNSPLQNTESLRSLTSLQELDLSNTPVNDLKMIENLKELKSLNCAGTQVRKLNTIRQLTNLEYLDCSNTFVSNLDPVYNISLKMLKCYNTKISKRKIEKYKKHHPACEVIYYR